MAVSDWAWSRLYYRFFAASFTSPRRESFHGDLTSTICLLLWTVAALPVARLTGRQRKVNEELTLFCSLVDHTSDAIHVIDPKTGRFLDVNMKARVTYGYTRREYLSFGTCDIDILGEQPWQKVAEKIRRDGHCEVESRHRRNDGLTFPVEVSFVYIHLNRDYIIAVARDTSDRKRAEAALRLHDRAIQGEERHAIGLGRPQGLGTKLASRGSSSTSIIPARDLVACSPRLYVLSGAATGSQTRKVVPTPFVLSTSIRPPLSATVL